VTDLAGTQISSLMETLPGIAQVLRSPVADAFINLIRAGAGQAPFNLADADEVMKYAVRRNLLQVDESERILAEAKEALAALAAAARARVAPAKPVAKAPPERKPAPVKKPAAAKKPVPAKKPAPARRPAPVKKLAPAKHSKSGRTMAKHPARKPARPAGKKPAPKK
jgi:outer membrane biosynthesis protein TonB